MRVNVSHQKEKGGNNRVIKQLHRQKDERTMRRRNRDVPQDREYVEINGRCMNREKGEIGRKDTKNKGKMLIKREYFRCIP